MPTRSRIPCAGRSSARRSVFLTVTLLVLGLLLLAPAGVRAQGQAIDGNIEGTVRLQGGGPLAGATIRAFNTGTGLERVVTTDARGRYALPLLPPGSYVLTAEATGHPTMTRANLDLRAGTVRTVEFDVPTTAFAETVEVTAAPPLVEVARTAASNTYDQRTVQSLPTIGRSIMDFFVLQPGVNAAPLPTTGSGTSTATTVYGGLNPRLLNVDGVSNNIQGRSRNIVISQDAISEAQVLTNFNAEFGRSVGGAQNIVTKSGSNNTRGSAFFFTRQKFMTGKPVLADQSLPKPDFSRYNFGGTVGGSLRKDKLFYFLSYERWMQDNPQVSTISAENAAALKIPSTSVGTITGTFRAHTLTTRADAQLSNNQRFSVRFNYYYDRESPIGGGLSSYETWTRFDENPYSITTQLVSVIRPNIVNENRFLYVTRGISRGPGAPDEDSPNVNITGVGSFNGAANGKNYTLERGFQFVDNLSISLGSHSVKLGLDIIPVAFKERTTNINGSFRFSGMTAVTGIRGAVTPLDQYLYTVAGTIDPSTGKPYSYTRFSQATGTEWTDPSVVNQGYFVQDDIRLPHRVKLNVGLRYDVFGRPQAKLNPQLPDTGRFPTDKNNIGPRIGLAWDPTGSGKTVLRGGWGIYYNVFVTQNFNNLIRSNGVDVVTVNMTPTTAGAPPFSLTPVSPPTQAVISEARTMAADFQDIQASLWFGTLERQLSKDLSLSVSYYGNTSSHQPVSLVTNITQNGTLADGRRKWSVTNRPDPRYANIYVASSVGDSQYDGLVMTLTKRFGSGYSFQGSYHVSKSTSAAFLADTLGFGIFTSPSDPQNVEVDRGNNDNDMRQRFTGTGVFEPRWSSLTGTSAALLNGWQFSTRIIIQTGYPYNALTGVDDNGEGVFNDRPSGIGYNAFNQANFSTVDIRMSRTFNMGAHRDLELMFEGFNMFNRKNITGVNTTYGPNITPNATFGQPTTAEAPRQFQLAARFNF
ncbi:MAG: TonB-dependent receptor [Acidobacteria bacterium]|nr:TonB-dependent receptor [Acidobacteriota bacterium]